MKKNISLILSILSLVAVIALAVVTLTRSSSKTVEGIDQETVKADIVYFQLDKVIATYDFATELSTDFDAKAQKVNQEVNSRRSSIESEITRRGNKLEADAKAWQEKIDKGLLTRSTAEVQGQKLQERQVELQNYAAQKQDEFAQYASQKQQELAEEQQVILNNIANAIKEYVDIFRAEKGYSLILSTQGDLLPSPVASADPALDITDALVAGLNAEYAKTKSSKK